MRLDDTEATPTERDQVAWSTDDTGRRRYHGTMTRHRQSPTDVELQDLDTAVAELTAARSMLVEAAQLHDRHERREQRKVALAKIGLAARFARDLSERKA